MEARELRLQVVVTAGPEDSDRALLALHTALAAATGGVQVHVFLVLRAAEWVCDGVPKDGLNGRVVRELEELRALGVEIDCCSVCADKHCSHSTHGTPSHVRPGVRSAGMMTLVQRVTSGVHTITF